MRHKWSCLLKLSSAVICYLYWGAASLRSHVLRWFETMNHSVAVLKLAIVLQLTTISVLSLHFTSDRPRMGFNYSIDPTLKWGGVTAIRMGMGGRFYCSIILIPPPLKYTLVTMELLVKDYNLSTTLARHTWAQWASNRAMATTVIFLLSWGRAFGRHPNLSNHFLYLPKPHNCQWIINARCSFSRSRRHSMLFMKLTSFLDYFRSVNVVFSKAGAIYRIDRHFSEVRTSIEGADGQWRMNIYRTDRIVADGQTDIYWIVRIVTERNWKREIGNFFTQSQPNPWSNGRKGRRDSHSFRVSLYPNGD